MKRNSLWIIMIMIIICMSFTACKSKKNQVDDTNEITIAPTIVPTQPAMETKDEQSEDTLDQEDTTDENSNEEYLSDSDAIKLILDVIGERGYTIELVNDQLQIGENTYYMYQISDSTSIIEPNVLVDKRNGEILCYNSDKSTAPFSEHPLYTEQNNTGANTNNEFTKEDALEKLSKVPADVLGLPVALTEYTIIYDDWTTNVNGVECYGINVYSKVGDKMINMGLYYVAVDGSVMYQFDSEMDDFVEIKTE